VRHPQHDFVVQASVQSIRAARTSAAFLLLGLVLSRPAQSEPNSAKQPSAREQAAAEYDRGVVAYDRGDYLVAAEAFLAADALVASNDALANAIAAARHTHDKHLLEEAGTRGLARAPTAPELGEPARTALLEAKALPDTTDAAAPSRAAAGTPVVVAPVPASAAPLSAPPTVERASSHGWSPAVFYAGTGVTLVLTGLTVWSGIDTLDAKAKLPGPPGANDRVMARAHRTDALLAATFVAAGATAYIGLRLVDWNTHTEVATSLGPGAATLTLRGVF
jgi:hypothetical protein